MVYETLIYIMNVCMKSVDCKSRNKKVSSGHRVCCRSLEVLRNKSTLLREFGKNGFWTLPSIGIITFYPDDHLIENCDSR